MKMNDNTILRIKVPAHLYEAVKAQLTIKEAKKAEKYGAGMTPVGKKAAGASSDKPKATKKANAPVKVHKGDSPGDNIPKADKDIPGMGLTEKKELGLEELKKLAELLNNEITKLQEKSHDKKEKAPVEEAFDVTKTMEIADTIKSALKAGKTVIVNFDENGKNGKEIEGIQAGRIKVKHSGPRDPITGGSGLSDIDLSNVTSLAIDGEKQTLPQSKEPEHQDVSQPAISQWDFTTGPMGKGRLD